MLHQQLKRRHSVAFFFASLSSRHLPYLPSPLSIPSTKVYSSCLRARSILDLSKHRNVAVCAVNSLLLLCNKNKKYSVSLHRAVVYLDQCGCAILSGVSARASPPRSVRRVQLDLDRDFACTDSRSCADEMLGLKATMVRSLLPSSACLRAVSLPQRLILLFSHLKLGPRLPSLCLPVDCTASRFGISTCARTEHHRQLGRVGGRVCQRAEAKDWARHGWHRCVYWPERETLRRIRQDSD